MRLAAPIRFAAAFVVLVASGCNYSTDWKITFVNYRSEPVSGWQLVMENPHHRNPGGTTREVPQIQARQTHVMTLTPLSGHVLFMRQGYQGTRRYTLVPRRGYDQQETTIQEDDTEDLCGTVRVEFRDGDTVAVGRDLRRCGTLY